MLFIITYARAVASHPWLLGWTVPVLGFFLYSASEFFTVLSALAGI